MARTKSKDKRPKWYPTSRYSTPLVGARRSARLQNSAGSDTVETAVAQTSSRKSRKSKKSKKFKKDVVGSAISYEVAASRVAASSVSSDYGSLSVLSAEILLMIFAELEYSHLKVCTMVSKSVSSLLEHPSFDQTLFRRVTPLTNCNSITPVSIPELKDFPGHENIWVEVHPALSMMSYSCSPDISDPTFYDYSDSATPRDARTVIETSAAAEYATMPAMQKLKIRIYTRPAILIMNKKGVTVLNVLEALVSHFGTEIGKAMLYDVCPWIEEYKKNRPAIWQDAQGDRNGWHGFEGQSMDDDGTLVLVADSFDS